MSKAVSIDENRIRDHLGEMIRGTVEQTLNAMLDAEAEVLCSASRYERSAERTDCRSGVVSSLCKGTWLFVSDACMGLVESLDELFPDADWQRCTVHFYRNVFSHVPKAKVRDVAMMLKAIHAQEDLAAARDKTQQVIVKLHAMKLRKAAQVVEAGIADTLTYYRYPDSHWQRIRTNNPMERLIKEIRRRTKVVGAFPDGHSAVMLAAARLRHVASTKWGTRRYLDMSKFREIDLGATTACADRATAPNEKCERSLAPPPTCRCHKRHVRRSSSLKSCCGLSRLWGPVQCVGAVG